MDNILLVLLLNRKEVLESSNQRGYFPRDGGGGASVGLTLSSLGRVDSTAKGFFGITSTRFEECWWNVTAFPKI